MSSMARAALVSFLFCLAAVLPAAGQKDPVQVSGRVRLVGSGLFPQLVISSPDGEWYVDKDEAHKLKELQQLTVTVEGSESVKKLKFANGRSAGEMRILTNITIIGIERPVEYTPEIPVGEPPRTPPDKPKEPPDGNNPPAEGAPSGNPPAAQDAPGSNSAP